MAIALLGAAFWALQPTGPQDAPQFVPVADGLFSLTQWWQPLPPIGRLQLPISVYLVRQEGKWVLIDAGVTGTPAQPHAEQLLAALRATIPEGDTLAAIGLTHAHPDHVGALPLLLDAYPDTPVVVHMFEQPFVVGDETYLPTNRLAAAFLRWNGFIGEQPLKVPAARVKSLEEPLSDFEAFGVEMLLYVVTLGHTPGHISMMHIPSRTVLAGDALSFARPSLRLADAQRDANDSRVAGTFKPWPSLPGLTLRALPYTLCLPHCDKERVQTSFCLLADGLEYNRLLASHDVALAHGSGGWSQEDMKSVAATRPACVALREHGGEFMDEEEWEGYVDEGEGEAGQAGGGKGEQGEDDDDIYTTEEDGAAEAAESEGEAVAAGAAGAGPDGEL